MTGLEDSLFRGNTGTDSFLTSFAKEYFSCYSPRVLPIQLLLSTAAKVDISTKYVASILFQIFPVYS